MSARKAKAAPYSHDWGTPPEVVALAHAVFRRPGDVEGWHVDFDPFTSQRWNELVRATVIRTAHSGGGGGFDPWFEQVGPLPLRAVVGDERVGLPVRVFCNPPGPGENVRRAWARAVEAWAAGAAVFWVAFSLEDLQRLQTPGIASPMDRRFLRCVPRKRLRFLDGNAIARGERQRNRPTGASALVFMPPLADVPTFSAARAADCDAMRVRFYSHAASLGGVA